MISFYIKKTHTFFHFSFTFILFHCFLSIFFFYYYHFFFVFRDVPECSGMFRDVPECSMFRVLSTAISNFGNLCSKVTEARIATLVEFGTTNNI